MSDAKPTMIKLEPISATKIIETKYDALRFLVRGLIVEGLTVLSGRPKIGKSWLALALAIACACGGAFLGLTAEKVDVLYLALEDSRRRIKSRLLTLGASSKLDGLYFLTEFPRLDAGAAEALDAWLATHPNVKLVIIDVLSKIRGARPKNADPYTHDAAELGKLQTIAQKHGASLVVLHHDRKATSIDWLDQLSGTLGLAGTADTVALLERDRGSANGRLRITGRDLDTEPDLALEFVNGLWHVIGPGDTLELTPERKAILAALPDHGEGLSPTQISLTTARRGVRVSTDTVKHALPALMKAGLVTLNRRGMYLRAISHPLHPPESLYES